MDGSCDRMVTTSLLYQNVSGQRFCTPHTDKCLRVVVANLRCLLVVRFWLKSLGETQALTCKGYLFLSNFARSRQILEQPFFEVLITQECKLGHFSYAFFFRNYPQNRTSLGWINLIEMMMCLTHDAEIVGVNHAIDSSLVKSSFFDSHLLV